MPPIIEGQLDANGLKVALIASRFNDFVTSRLVEGRKAWTRFATAVESSLAGGRA